MRDNIVDILTQLKEAGYIKNVEFYKNHFYYRICNLDTKEQKEMIKDKMETFIDETEEELDKIRTVKALKEYIKYWDKHGIFDYILTFKHIEGYLCMIEPIG